MNKKKICTVEGCGKSHSAKGLCAKHYLRVRRYNVLTAAPKKTAGEGYTDPKGRVFIRRNGAVKARARWVVEDVLGKSLPQGAEVHHVDGNPSNDAPTNLVVCPDKGYHRLLHLRTKAYIATGDPTKRMCKFCRQYDEPTNLSKLRSTREVYGHKNCNNESQRMRRKKMILAKGA